MLNHPLQSALEHIQSPFPIPLPNCFLYPFCTQVWALHSELAANEFGSNFFLFWIADHLQHVPPAEVKLAFTAYPLSRSDIAVALFNIAQVLEYPPGPALYRRLDGRELGILRGIYLHHAVGMHMHPYGCLLVLWQIAQVVPELPVTVPGHVLQRLFVLFGLYGGHQRATPLRRI